MQMATNNNNGGNNNHTTAILTAQSHILIEESPLVSTQLSIMGAGLRESNHMSVAFLVEIL